MLQFLYDNLSEEAFAKEDLKGVGCLNAFLLKLLELENKVIVIQSSGLHINYKFGKENLINN